MKRSLLALLAFTLACQSVAFSQIPGDMDGKPQNEWQPSSTQWQKHIKPPQWNESPNSSGNEYGNPPSNGSQPTSGTWTLKPNVKNYPNYSSQSPSSTSASASNQDSFAPTNPSGKNQTPQKPMFPGQLGKPARPESTSDLPNPQFNPNNARPLQGDFTKFAPRWEYGRLSKITFYANERTTEEHYVWVSGNLSTRIHAQDVEDLIEEINPDAQMVSYPDLVMAMSALGEQSWEMMSCQTYPLTEGQARYNASSDAPDPSQFGAALGRGIGNFVNPDQRPIPVDSWNNYETDCLFKRAETLDIR